MSVNREERVVVLEWGDSNGEGEERLDPGCF